MADKRNLRAIWDSTDQSYINALAEGKKTSGIHDKRRSRDEEDSDSDSRSTSSAFSELYAAIPNEFRPRKATTSFTRTFSNNNGRQKIGKTGRLMPNEFEDLNSSCNADVVINRRHKDMTPENLLNFTEHPQQKTPSNVTDNRGTRYSNLPQIPVTKPVSSCIDTSEAKNVKYNNEIAKSDNPFKFQSVSRSNVHEEEYKNGQSLSVYKNNKPSEITTNIASKKCTPSTSCGISTLLVDCESEEEFTTDARLGVLSPSREKVFHSKLSSNAYVSLPSETENKGGKACNVYQRDTVNFNDNARKRNNLSKVSQAHSISSEKEESISYNICAEKLNAEKIDCEHKKQNVDKTDNELTGFYKNSQVVIIERKCYINNCCCDQRSGDIHCSEIPGPPLDHHRSSGYAEGEINSDNKQSYPKNRSFHHKNHYRNSNHRRNRSQWAKYKHRNSFQNSQSKFSKSNENLPDSSSSTRKHEKSVDDSRNKNFTNFPHCNKNIDSEDVSYSVRSSECPSTSSSGSDDDDDEQSVKYRHIVPSDSHAFEQKLYPKSSSDHFLNRSSKTNRKGRYSKKNVRWGENCSRKYESNLGTEQRSQETVEISETEKYMKGKLLHEVAYVNYEEIKSNSQEREKSQKIAEENSKQCPTNLQCNNGKYTRQSVKWGNNLSVNWRYGRSFSTEKPFTNAGKKSSRINSRKISSSQLRDTNVMVVETSQNEAKAMDQPVSKTEEVESYSFSYTATNLNKKTMDDVNTLPNTELKVLKSSRHASDDFSGFCDKLVRKIEKSSNYCHFSDFKSVINGRGKNVHNYPERKNYSINADLSVESKLEPAPSQALNKSETPVVRSSSNNPAAGTTYKNECAKDLTSVLEMEETAKQINELSGFTRECLIVDNELSVKRKILMNYGQEISDFILGNYFAVEDLSSLFSEWSEKRSNTMQLCVTLARNLVHVKNVPGKWNEILKQIKLGADLVSGVPVPYCSIVGRLISVVTSIVSAMMPSSNSKPSDLDEIAITLSLQQDLEVSSELYRQCLTCDQQFQNAFELIEKFYLVFTEENYECLFKTSQFLQEIMELKPGHSTYYKRFKKAIEKTIQKDLKSELELSFCQLFIEYPSALNMVEKLDWRFKAEGFNLDSFEDRWQELSLAFLSYDSLTVDDLIAKIQNCVRTFGREELVVKRALSRFC